ncbi:hypothetical protein MTO96_045642 [Rhipicephalus appendiculatus]
MEIIDPPVMYYRRASADHHHLIFFRPLRRKPERCKTKLDTELRKTDCDKFQPQAFVKNIYCEHPTTASQSAADADDYRCANSIAIVKGREPVAKTIMDVEEARSFPDEAIDAVRDERNGCAPTCVDAQSSGLRSVCIHSSVTNDTPHAELAPGCDVCVGTPRRLLEFVMEQRLKLLPCTFICHRRGRRMQTMGLEREVTKIAQKIRPDHQTVMCACSWPKGTRRLVECLLEDYIQVNFGSAQPRVVGIK